MSYNIKDMVKDNKRVKFCYYRHEELYYITECGFMFTVPISDTGDATFLAEDKAMLFMRYIRKQIEAIKRDNAEFESIKGDAPPLITDDQVKILKDIGLINDENELTEKFGGVGMVTE